MRFLLPGLFILIIYLAAGQSVTRPYWQQKLNYHITANVKPQEHIVDGNLILEYTNLSPDTLSFIWFHLWPYANDKTTLFKQIKQLKGRNKKPGYPKRIWIYYRPQLESGQHDRTGGAASGV